MNWLEELVRGLEVSEVSLYLACKNWRLLDEAERWTLWTLSHDVHELELLVPTKIDAPDYTTLLTKAVLRLAELENRDPRSIVRDMRATGVDVIRIQTKFAGDATGSLPLLAIPSLFGGTHDLVEASARAANGPQRAFRERRPRVVEDFLRTVRLDQTELGSYVLRVLCPVPGGRIPRHEASSDNFPRAVTRTLASSLAALSDAVRRTQVLQDLTPFDGTIERGVSSNLCNALASLGHESLQLEQVRVDLSWSAGLSAPELPASFTFTPVGLEVVAAGAERLRQQQAEEGYELSGKIIALSNRDPSHMSGTITIHTDAPSVRQIKVQLEADAYDIAVRAHLEGARVSCRGRLERRGRHYELAEPNDFRRVE
jgi:hypothetical protein